MKPQPAQNELLLVRDRFVRSVLPVHAEDTAALIADVTPFRATLGADGNWPDIDYANTSRSTWTTCDHLQRVLRMAKLARYERNSGRVDAALEQQAKLALDWWTAHDYQNSNWWWNEIGVPELMGEIGNLLLPILSAEELRALDITMRRSDWRGNHWTGANLTWGLINQIARGLLQSDRAMVAEAYRQMGEGIRVVSAAEEGIQQDESFHQHGRQLYNGGYGLDFANDVGRFLSFAWGTRFEVPADRLAIYSAFLLDGEQWMIRGDVFDYSTVGREITRPGKVAAPHGAPGSPISPAAPEYSLGRVTQMLSAESLPRQREFQIFAVRLAGKPGIPELSGNRSFWLSDYMVHRRSGYMTSVKMLSSRMKNAEVVNSEGKQSVHLSDGVNLLYLTGDEYRDIFPVWDWTRLPGTTAIQGTLVTGERDPVGTIGQTSFDGSVSDGTYGLAAMDLKRGALSAQKAWFFFDDAYVALGAGITLTEDMQHAVATDVNQTLLDGDVLSSTASGPLAQGRHHIDAAPGTWIYHDHVGYLFPERTQLTLEAGPRTGSWSTIGTGPAQPVTRSIFDLWIQHGTAPRDAGYEYIVLPNISRGQLAARSRAPRLRILANAAELQSVYDPQPGLVEAVFRKAGTLRTPLGVLSVDQACLLLAARSAHGWKITASNPENQALTLTVQIDANSLTLSLPGGEAAGSSLTSQLNASAAKTQPNKGGDR